MSAIASTTVANATAVATSTPSANLTRYVGNLGSCNSPSWYEDYQSDTERMSICMVDRIWVEQNPEDEARNRIAAECCKQVGGRLWTNNNDNNDDNSIRCPGFGPVVNCLTNDSKKWMECLPKTHKTSTCLSKRPRQEDNGQHPGQDREKDSGALTGVAPLGRTALGVLVVFALAVVSQ